MQKFNLLSLVNVKQVDFALDGYSLKAIQWKINLVKCLLNHLQVVVLQPEVSEQPSASAGPAEGQLQQEQGGRSLSDPEDEAGQKRPR